MFYGSRRKITIIICEYSAVITIVITVHNIGGLKTLWCASSSICCTYILQGRGEKETIKQYITSFSTTMTLSRRFANDNAILMPP